MFNGKPCGYVYKFINDCNEIMYIGSTGNIEQRMSAHFNARSGHSKRLLKGIDRIAEIRYCELPTRNDALIAETILIQRYKPKGNKATTADGNVSLASFDESSVMWVTKKPSDFLKKHPYNKRILVDAKEPNGSTFNALRMLFPDVDLRKDGITAKQKHVLFIAFMQDAEYWSQRLTDFETELVHGELFNNVLRRAGVYVDAER